MPTARWVLPVPILPMISRPVPSRGSYSCANLEAQRKANEREEGAPGKSVVKLESSQCSYLRGMRAAVIKEAARARTWQSHRATRRSASEPSRAPKPDKTVFHPVPSHSGQTSTGALITELPRLRFVDLTVPHQGGFTQVLTPVSLCTSCAAGIPSVEG